MKSGGRIRPRVSRFALALLVFVPTAACGTLLGSSDDNVSQPNRESDAASEAASLDGSEGGSPGSDAPAPGDAQVDVVDAAPVNKVVFVTNMTTVGDMTFDGTSNLRGRDGADYKCQTEAVAAGISSGALAWLSTTGSAAVDRLPATGVQWVRPDGVMVFEDTAHLRQLMHPMAQINQLATGGPAVPNGAVEEVWTGTQSDGSIRGVASERCNDWMASDMSTMGFVGVYASTTSDWTAYSTVDFCSNSRLVICFQK